jgi:hypothetical protein
MGFLSFLLLAAITYLVWRITDQLPDLIFRISEIQRDVAELRRTLTDAPARASTTTNAPGTARRIDPGEAATDSLS